jgi:hypothetical protein
VARKNLLDRIAGRLAMMHVSNLTRRFFKAAERATTVQDELLAGVLARHADSDFGREHHFDRIRNYADFKANLPIRSYADFAPYIDRLCRGEVKALFHPDERILMFALTSGTTAKPKYIPITPQVLADSRHGWGVWGGKAVLDHPDVFLRHILQVTSPMDDHRTASGVPCGAITGLLASTQKKLVLRYYTSPLAIARIPDALSKYYTIMRLAIPRDVAWVVTANPATLLLLAKTANDRCEQMIRDIRDGTLSKDLPVAADIRAELAPRLRPDPTCARRLETIIARQGAMYPKHYWNLGFRAHWCGGTMGLYESQFPRYYGQVPARDIGLIASEGRMSIPVDDGTASGILAIGSQFFEFIPAEAYDAALGREVPTLRSHELREGEEYFLVLTNAGGLYRYDMGDRVRVTGRLGQAPLIEFLSRDAHTASMAGEKLTEDQVVMAMRQVCDEGHRPIVDFVLAPRWGEVPRYRLYVEADAARRLDRLHERLDRALGEVNLEYASKRSSLRLEAVELAELPDGALALRDETLRRRRAGTSEQFKHQYLLPRPEMDRDLEQVPTGAA